MEIIRLNEAHADAAAPLIAGFRSALRSYKGSNQHRIPKRERQNSWNC